MAPAAADDVPDAELIAFAKDAGLLGRGEAGCWVRLAGGVSSDIWRLDRDPERGRPVCIKRALAKLRVADAWYAPLERSLNEWRWLRFVHARFPDFCPAPVAVDEARRIIAMAFLVSGGRGTWKDDLLAGQADPVVARAVGRRLGRVHAASAQDPACAAQFQTDDAFFALRLDPYLLATTERRPEVGPHLRDLAASTAKTHRALVHGDVSPKNILPMADGPVFLDAECAWWGDPAFDLAFCLNHLLLKEIAAPRARLALGACFDALSAGYLCEVDWEPPSAVERRAAALLPALALARIDGKSPVEYIARDRDKNRVRAFALPLLKAPVETLGRAFQAWSTCT